MNYPEEYDKLMAKAALKAEWITREQLEECAGIQQELANKEQNVALIELLVEKKLSIENATGCVVARNRTKSASGSQANLYL